VCLSISSAIHTTIPSISFEEITKPRDSQQANQRAEGPDGIFDDSVFIIL
jgi:hypothetical protein